MADHGPDVALHDALADVLHRFHARADDLGNDVAAAFIAVITPSGFDAVRWWGDWCQALSDGELIREGQGVDRWSEAGSQAIAEELAADHLARVFGKLLDVITTQDLGARVALWAPQLEEEHS